MYRMGIVTTVHYRNSGDHSLAIDLSNARETITKQHETFWTNALGLRPIENDQGILKKTKEYLRKREEEEGTKTLSRRKSERVWEREEDRIGEDEVSRGKGRCARKAGSFEPREINEVYKKEPRGKRS